MSWITDTAGKLVQSFLTLDDLVAGQGLAQGTVDQIGHAGRLAAATAAASTNLAARGVHLGVQAGARAARWTASSVSEVMPGADFTARVADDLDRRAGAAGEQAAQVASYAIGLVGVTPRNPLDGSSWMGKEAPVGYGWGELAADTTVGTWGGVATLPLAVGLELAHDAAGTSPGRATIDASMQGFGMVLDQLPGRAAGELGRDELREAILAISSGTGAALGSAIYDLALGLLRCAMGDRRLLHRALGDALDDLRVLADGREIEGLLPPPPIGGTLRARARRVVAKPPEAFLAALGLPSAGGLPPIGELVTAFYDDLDALRIFATEYPQIVGYLGADDGLLGTAALADVEELEGYARGDEGARRPWSALYLETFVGRAEGGGTPFPSSVVGFARDVSFLYSSRALGREKARARAVRLFGKTEAEDLDGDISLELGILDAESAEARRRRVRERVDGAERGDLAGRIDSARARLAALRDFAASPYRYQPGLLHRRREILGLFVSLAGQRLALADADESAGRPEAFGTLAKWADTLG